VKGLKFDDRAPLATRVTVRLNSLTSRGLTVSFGFVRVRRGRAIQRPATTTCHTSVKGTPAMTEGDIDALIAERNTHRALLIETERQLDLLDDKTERHANVAAECDRLFDLMDDCDTAIWGAPTTSLSHLIEKISIALHWAELGFEPAELICALRKQLQSAPFAMG
jgi:hypothetical protein